MSQFATPSDVDAVVGGLSRQQVMDLVRGATFIGTLLLAWLTLHPFADLGQLEAGDVSTGNEALTYVMFGSLAVLTMAQDRAAAELLQPGPNAARLLVTAKPVAALPLSVVKLTLTVCLADPIIASISPVGETVATMLLGTVAA